MLGPFAAFSLDPEVVDFGSGFSAEMRFFGMLCATMMDSWAGVGDLPMFFVRPQSGAARHHG